MESTQRNRIDKAVLDSVVEVMGEGAGHASFDEAFNLHWAAVFRTAVSVVRDAALAEDITQEVFLRLYRYRNETPAADLLRAWLLRITLNVARNTVLRAENRGPESPEAAYQRRGEIEAVRSALDKLQEPMRSCLLLKHQGLSYREIAETLSVKENNVGSLVARGRKEFARFYGQIGEARSTKKRPIGAKPLELLGSSEITHVEPKEASTEAPNNETRAAINGFRAALDEVLKRMELEQLQIVRLQKETRETLTKLEGAH